jgi:hypothetical protein
MRQTSQHKKPHRCVGMGSLIIAAFAPSNHVRPTAMSIPSRLQQTTTSSSLPDLPSPGFDAPTPANSRAATPGPDATDSHESTPASDQPFEPEQEATPAPDSSHAAASTPVSPPASTPTAGVTAVRVRIPPRTFATQTLLPEQYAPWLEDAAFQALAVVHDGQTIEMAVDSDGERVYTIVPTTVSSVKLLPIDGMPRFGPKFAETTLPGLNYWMWLWRTGMLEAGRWLFDPAPPLEMTEEQWGQLGSLIQEYGMAYSEETIPILETSEDLDSLYEELFEPSREHTPGSTPSVAWMGCER